MEKNPTDSVPAFVCAALLCASDGTTYILQINRRRNMLIFSAVGKKTTDKKGRFMVEAAGEEYYLVNMEVYVWSALL